MGLFKLEKTYDDQYIISTDYETILKYGLTLPAGMSYSLLASHLCGYRCADYFRMLRDVYGAELWKGQTIWPTARFKKRTPELNKLVQELNRKATAAWRKEMGQQQLTFF